MNIMDWKEEYEGMAQKYWDRIESDEPVTGIRTKPWTAYTLCEACRTPWMWGVEHNLFFVCPDCKERDTTKEDTLNQIIKENSNT